MGVAPPSDGTILSQMAVIVECLKCGQLRRMRGPLDHVMRAGHCPRCGYVGWAVSGELTERERRELRDLPVERRRYERPVRRLAVR